MKNIYKDNRASFHWSTENVRGLAYKPLTNWSSTVRQPLVVFFHSACVGIHSVVLQKNFQNDGLRCPKAQDGQLSPRHTIRRRPVLRSPPRRAPPPLAAQPWAAPPQPACGMVRVLDSTGCACKAFMQSMPANSKETFEVFGFLDLEPSGKDNVFDRRSHLSQASGNASFQEFDV